LPLPMSLLYGGKGGGVAFSRATLSPPWTTTPRASHGTAECPPRGVGAAPSSSSASLPRARRGHAPAQGARARARVHAAAVAMQRSGRAGAVHQTRSRTCSRWTLAQ